MASIAATSYGSTFFPLPLLCWAWAYRVVGCACPLRGLPLRPLRGLLVRPWAPARPLAPRSFFGSLRCLAVSSHTLYAYAHMYVHFCTCLYMCVAYLHISAYFLVIPTTHAHTARVYGFVFHLCHTCCLLTDIFFVPLFVSLKF
mgnify:CR=1 FL=1